MQGDPLVSIQCLVFNHERYLRQCLDGFVMQQTSFPFEAIVHDDASTDGSAAIIREYAEKYPDIIKPIFETENQYSKHDGSLRRVVHAAIHPAAKYVAICEGDDYWTDPHKLQIQVDYLSSHDTCSMCWHDAKKMDARTCRIFGDHRRYRKDTTCSTEDMIILGGGGCPTASIIYRRDILAHAPDLFFDRHVGDYPLQLYLAFNGYVRYIDRPMSVYRIHVPGSWTSSMAVNTNIEERKKLWSMTIKLFDDYNEYSDFQYEKAFNQRKNIYLFHEYFAIGDYSTARKYWYKCNISTRPWSLGVVLYVHGLGSLVKSIKKIMS